MTTTNEEEGPPQPFYYIPPPPETLYEKMNDQYRLSYHEKARMAAAIYRIKKVYPGVVGEVLATELTTWVDFGYRFGGTKLVNRLIHHALTTPLPLPPAPTPPDQFLLPASIPPNLTNPTNPKE